MFTLLRGLELLDTEEGKAWFMESGWKSIKSNKGINWWFHSNKEWKWLKNDNGKLFFLEHIVELESDQASEINHIEGEYKEM